MFLSSQVLLSSLAILAFIGCVCADPCSLSLSYQRNSGNVVNFINVSPQATASELDLEDLLSCSDLHDVMRSTSPVWLTATGGHGVKHNNGVDSSSNGGFASGITTASVAPKLYYLLGDHGDPGSNCGGGGASTMFMKAPPSSYTSSDVILVAGGGGGQGASPNEGATANGGAGATIIGTQATTGNCFSGAAVCATGSEGGKEDHNDSGASVTRGQGGDSGTGGAKSGADGFGGYGGACHDSHNSAYINYSGSVPAGGTGGNGESKGSDGCHSRSGGGGGGYGGGGGGDGHTHTAPSCQLTVCGGGGGGSFALLPAFEDPASPTTKGDVSSLTGTISVSLHYGYYIHVEAALVTMDLVISAPKSGVNMKLLVNGVETTTSTTLSPGESAHLNLYGYSAFAANQFSSDILTFTATNSTSGQSSHINLGMNSNGWYFSSATNGLGQVTISQTCEASESINSGSSQCVAENLSFTEVAISCPDTNGYYYNPFTTEGGNICLPCEAKDLCSVPCSTTEDICTTCFPDTANLDALNLCQPELCAWGVGTNNVINNNNGSCGLNFEPTQVSEQVAQYLVYTQYVSDLFYACQQLEPSCSSSSTSAACDQCSAANSANLANIYLSKAMTGIRTNLTLQSQDDVNTIAPVLTAIEDLAPLFGLNALQLEAQMYMYTASAVASNQIFVPPFELSYYNSQINEWLAKMSTLYGYMLDLQGDELVTESEITELSQQLADMNDLYSLNEENLSIVQQNINATLTLINKHVEELNELQNKMQKTSNKISNDVVECEATDIAETVINVASMAGDMYAGYTAETVSKSATAWSKAVTAAGEVIDSLKDVVEMSQQLDTITVQLTSESMTTQNYTATSANMTALLEADPTDWITSANDLNGKVQGQCSGCSAASADCSTFQAQSSDMGSLGSTLAGEQQYLGQLLQQEQYYESANEMLEERINQTQTLLNNYEDTEEYEAQVLNLMEPLWIDMVDGIQISLLNYCYSLLYTFPGEYASSDTASAANQYCSNMVYGADQNAPSDAVQAQYSLATSTDYNQIYSSVLGLQQAYLSLQGCYEEMGQITTPTYDITDVIGEDEMDSLRANGTFAFLLQQSDIPDMAVYYGLRSYSLWMELVGAEMVGSNQQISLAIETTAPFTDRYVDSNNQTTNLDYGLTPYSYSMVYTQRTSGDTCPSGKGTSTICVNDDGCSSSSVCGDSLIRPTPWALYQVQIEFLSHVDLSNVTAVHITFGELTGFEVGVNSYACPTGAYFDDDDDDDDDGGDDDDDDSDDDDASDDDDGSDDDGSGSSSSSSSEGSSLAAPLLLLAVMAMVAI